MKRFAIPAVLLAGVVIAVVLASSGGESSSKPAAAAGSGPPDITLARIDGGPDVALSSLASAGKPTLVWFWAPWCEICNAEAPKIQRLSAESADELNVVAIGGRDKTAAGQEFVERHGLEAPTVLYDEPEAAWKAYRVGPQPTGVLLDKDGREQQRWVGAFETDEVLAATRGS